MPVRRQVIHRIGQGPGLPVRVRAYAFLASGDAGFIHGSALVIGGGQLAVM